MKPSKIVITAGKKITKTEYDGEVAPIDLLNAAKALIEDVHKLDGKITHKMAIALIAQSLEIHISFKNETMRASQSALTATE